MLQKNLLLMEPVTSILLTSPERQLRGRPLH